MKKIIIACFAIFIIGPILFRVFMYYTSKDVFTYAEKVMRGEVPLEETAGRKVDRYQYKLDYPIDKVNVTLKVIWVVHDFYKGEAEVYYHMAHYSNGLNVFGSVAYSTWYIEKINGKWEIVKIIEKP